MANFLPLKNYILFCIDKIISEFKLNGPFLDVGCGIGDVSYFLSFKGWQGAAIDLSKDAIVKAKERLTDFPQVIVEHKSLAQVEGMFNTVFCLDVLEHIKDDVGALKHIYNLLLPEGYLVVSVPTNPREWRWDDDFYGHYRRYNEIELKEKLCSCGFTPLVFWDFTYPIFWLMRRIYCRIKPAVNFSSDQQQFYSQKSSLHSAWQFSWFPRFVSGISLPWDIIYKLQFVYCKDMVEKGHEMLVVARRKG